jgi:hypothetical protein
MSNRLEIDVIEDLQWSREMLANHFCVVKRRPSAKNICEQLAAPNLVRKFDMLSQRTICVLLIASCYLLT